MTTRQFCFRRSAELHEFFKLTFKGRWLNHIRKTLGPTCVNALKPYYRRRGRFSLQTLAKLEQYAKSLGFKPLSSESPSVGSVGVRCPACQAALSVTLKATLAADCANLAQCATKPKDGTLEPKPITTSPLPQQSLGFLLATS